MVTTHQAIPNSFEATFASSPWNLNLYPTAIRDAVEPPGKFCAIASVLPSIRSRTSGFASLISMNCVQAEAQLMQESRDWKIAFQPASPAGYTSCRLGRPLPSFSLFRRSSCLCSSWLGVCYGWTQHYWLCRARRHRPRAFRSQRHLLPRVPLELDLKEDCFFLEQSALVRAAFANARVGGFVHSAHRRQGKLAQPESQRRDRFGWLDPLQR